LFIFSAGDYFSESIVISALEPLFFLEVNGESSVSSLLAKAILVLKKERAEEFALGNFLVTWWALSAKHECIESHFYTLSTSLQISIIRFLIKSSLSLAFYSRLIMRSLGIFPDNKSLLEIINDWIFVFATIEKGKGLSLKTRFSSPVHWFSPMIPNWNEFVVYDK
jgi:hypothetical protein